VIVRRSRRRHAARRTGAAGGLAKATGWGARRFKRSGARSACSRIAPRHSSCRPIRLLIDKVRDIVGVHASPTHAVVFCCRREVQIQRWIARNPCCDAAGQVRSPHDSRRPDTTLLRRHVKTSGADPSSSAASLRLNRPVPGPVNAAVPRHWTYRQHGLRAIQRLNWDFSVDTNTTDASVDACTTHMSRTLSISKRIGRQLECLGAMRLQPNAARSLESSCAPPGRFRQAAALQCVSRVASPRASGRSPARSAHR